jgi:hypothetical protein
MARQAKYESAKQDVPYRLIDVEDKIDRILEDMKVIKAKLGI